MEAAIHHKQEDQNAQDDDSYYDAQYLFPCYIVDAGCDGCGIQWI